MNANPRRGDTLLIVDGISYILRPTYRALIQIEDELSLGLLAVAQKICDERITLRELVTIIDHCMENRAERQFLGDAVVRGGLHNAIASVTALLALVIGGFNNESLAGVTAVSRDELMEMLRNPDERD